MVFQNIKLRSALPAYYQFPEFLLHLELSQTEKILYMILYDRARLSKQNGWTDDAGNVYIIFPVKEMAAVSGRSLSAIKVALCSLENANLISRVSGGFSKPNHIYVKIPKADQAHGVTKRAFIKPEGSTYDSQGTNHMKDRFLAPNKVIETSNKNKDTGIRMEYPDYSCEEGESL